MTPEERPCVLAQVRYHDAEAMRWGYAVECVVEAHRDRVCPGEWEQLVAAQESGSYAVRNPITMRRSA